MSRIIMTTTSLASLALVSLGLVVTGCGKKETSNSEHTSSVSANTQGTVATNGSPVASGATKQTCDTLKTNSKCGEYTTDAAMTAGKIKCGMRNGKWGTDACPAGGFATCIRDGETLTYYKGQKAEVELNADMAKADCEMVDGKFVTLAVAAGNANEVAKAKAAAPKKK